MSQAVITKAFTEWKAQQAINNQPVALDEFIFAYIPGLDADKPIDNTETAPAADKIVYRQVVSKSGVVNENSVVYSVTMGADVGDFDFNWIGLANKATGTLAMIIHAPTQRKIKNANGQQGNVLVRSMLMEYSGAREATEITTPAETWQIDFTARLAAMDERQRRENIDLYGAASFFDAGYLVAKTGTQYFVTKGTGYLAGLRSVLAANQNITVSTKPVKVWLDVAWMGTLTSIWAVQSKITVAADLKDYVQNGEQHFVFALASIDANGVITDLRPKGTLNEQQASDALKKHEQSRNHPDATTTAKGFTQLSSATDSDSEEVAATPKAVKATYDLAKGKYTAQDATTAQKGIIQLSSATDSESEAVAATPKAVKAANDNANSRVPSTRTVNGRALSSNIDLFPSDIFRLAEGIGNAANLNNYTTPGLYYQPANAQAQTGTNYPEAIAGSLEVLKHAGITQIYRVYNNSRSYARTLYGGTWSAWTKAYDVANKPTPAEIGALASNGNAVSASQLQTARTINGVAFNGTANITISAGSIGSYTKAESDARYNLKNTASLGQNGWERDGTTGRIRQWGYTNQTSGYQNITFPIAFPNACRNIQVTPFTSNVAGTLECSVSQYSNTTARLNANQGFPLFWLATGY
ncbi:TPA: tail fiber protein [Escherichia coli]|uniref:tail fiber protein n=1 Tax=Escherichia coli TaxID=562 RepID=UPI0001F65D34|nr:tail fiber protein [Escherichia coli]EFW73379.1 Tail fiber protein [Escherichia coli EC4100B]GDF91490.1 phage side tail fiber protein [Escherichia coli]GDP41303.1 phage side tail fiber protein [Escherichia coli]GDV68724.1 phage side tail fiber protein [Escherichia coli]GDW18624.1 phage side tail fiber protein [Escherichia coli]